MLIQKDLSLPGHQNAGKQTHSIKRNGIFAHHSQAGTDPKKIEPFGLPGLDIVKKRKCHQRPEKNIQKIGMEKKK